MLYIKQNINYKVRKDLNLYKSKELESVFIEIIDKKGKNTIVGSIYRHPSMQANIFSNDFLDPLLEKLSYENKNIVLLGDYNITASEFLDILTSNSVYPVITCPTRLTSHSKTLIDNILMNDLFKKLISGNITVSISEHLAQFAICVSEEVSSNEKPTLQYKRNFKTFDHEKFILDLYEVDWEQHLQKQKPK